jgi:hypothetical protein
VGRMRLLLLHMQSPCGATPFVVFYRRLVTVCANSTLAYCIMTSVWRSPAWTQRLSLHFITTLCMVTGCALFYQVQCMEGGLATCGVPQTYTVIWHCMTGPVESRLKLSFRYAEPALSATGCGSAVVL